MAEIKLSKRIKYASDVYNRLIEGGFDEENAILFLEGIPDANVVPVVHGRWVHLGGDEWCCSACGFVITTEGSWDKPTKKKYCEDCGAKMDGGDNNDECAY